MPSCHPQIPEEGLIPPLCSTPKVPAFTLPFSLHQHKFPLFQWLLLRFQIRMCFPILKAVLLKPLLAGQPALLSFS